MAIASIRAGEAISAGDAVFVSSAGLVFKADASSFERASVAGIAVDSVSAGGLVRVNLDGIYTSTNTYTPADLLYLSITNPGSYDTYDSVASGLALTSSPGIYLTEVGTAVTSNKINVEVSQSRFLPNPTSVLLLEVSAGVTLDVILQEDGSTISTEDAT